MFFRRGVSNDAWVEVKLWLFSAGALLALLGMGLRNDWLIGAAALVLASGILLRFVDRRGSEASSRDVSEASRVSSTEDPPQAGEGDDESAAPRGP